MNHRHWFVVVLTIWCTGFATAGGRGGCNYDTGRVIQTVSGYLEKENTLQGANTPLRVVVEEELEQDIIGYQIYGWNWAKSSQKPAVREVAIYRAMPAGLFVEKGTVVRQVIQVDRYDEWLVAVECGTGDVIGLRGFPDAQLGFGTLMKKLGSSVVSEEDALRTVQLFFELAASNELGKVLTDEVMLETAVMSDYYHRRPVGQWRKLYKQWWGHFPDSLKKELREPRAISSEEGYRVEYLRYDDGTVVRETLIVSRSGAVVQQEPTVVYNPNIP